MCFAKHICLASELIRRDVAAGNEMSGTDHKGNSVISWYDRNNEDAFAACVRRYSFRVPLYSNHDQHWIGALYTALRFSGTDASLYNKEWILLEMKYSQQ